MKIRRAITALTVVAAAGVVPLMTAAPAQADQIDCVEYLRGKGYEIGPRVRAACDTDGSMGGTIWCNTSLIALGVRGSHASAACSRA
ncbi:hypothetical protein [Streptomyces sp. enrichment culture]|uniref:hypothetical protein n=1 Tax=Streptomyces sp. enrichment culture TaxID=1795815 RepID=UPI003F57C578